MDLVMITEGFRCMEEGHRLLGQAIADTDMEQLRKDGKDFVNNMCFCHNRVEREIASFKGVVAEVEEQEG